jgi:hypothetical protein
MKLPVVDGNSRTVQRSQYNRKSLLSDFVRDWKDGMMDAPASNPQSPFPLERDRFDHSITRTKVFIEKFLGNILLQQGTFKKQHDPRGIHGNNT